MRVIFNYENCERLVRDEKWMIHSKNIIANTLQDAEKINNSCSVYEQPGDAMSFKILYPTSEFFDELKSEIKRMYGVNSELFWFASNYSKQVEKAENWMSKHLPNINIHAVS